jgi:hypothetical protein
LYPDTREAGITQHVTAVQAAHLIRVLAVNVNPVGDAYEDKLLRYVDLRAKDGSSFIQELATLLKDAGLQLYVQGVSRISLSLDRNFATIIYEDPTAKHLLKESDVTTFRVREHEKIFGDSGIKKFERFAILKRSALQELATAINNTGSVPQEQAELILTHVNESP